MEEKKRKRETYALYTQAEKTWRVNRANKGGRVEMGLKICKEGERVFFYELMKGSQGKKVES